MLPERILRAASLPGNGLRTQDARVSWDAEGSVGWRMRETIGRGMRTVDKQPAEPADWHSDGVHMQQTLTDNVRPGTCTDPTLESHFRFHYLPRDVIEKKVKVVYITRNPKDVFVSLYCHLSKVRPPRGYEGTWPPFFAVMLEQGCNFVTWSKHVIISVMTN
ncbi:hypothetical protein BaRGS_00009965 [Batillaria attramentaria]|uniref:Sulfotransferase domain-containing protein n=1 Tax=Batillaria attramentaria TaxID=370345 RepID=A0ABD0LID8_9CAEN